jgi:hypothetical protein
MELNKTYTRVLTNFNKEGKGFTSTSGEKFITYRVNLAGEISSYLMSIPAGKTIEQFDEIKFKLTLGKGGKIRLSNVKFTKDVKFTYDVNKSLQHLFQNDFDN